MEKMAPDFSKLSTHLLHIDASMTAEDVARNEEVILKEIHRLNVVMEEWRTRKNVNEEERHKVVMLIQKEIDLLKNILTEWKRRAEAQGLLSVFIRSIEHQLNDEAKYYYSLLIIQDIVRLQRESARWRAANENQELQCWYIQEKNSNISFDQEKVRQLKMLREEIDRLVQILKEWQWRKLTNSRWIHQVYTPDYTATTKHPGVFIYDKNGTTTGIARPVGKLIDRTRGDQPPHQFEEDYISEEELEEEPGIGLYPQVLEPLILATTMRPVRPTLPQMPVQQTVEVFPTAQREYRRREYQKTTITTNTGVMVSETERETQKDIDIYFNYHQQPQQQFHMSASASAGGGGGNTQRQIPLWAATQTTLADVDPTLSGLESMNQMRPHVSQCMSKSKMILNEISSCPLLQDVQQTQPIFEVDDGQKSYNAFDDPIMHARESEKDLMVQKTMSPKEEEPVPLATIKEDQVPAKEAEVEPTATNEKSGFWKKFGDKAKGIFG